MSLAATVDWSQVMNATNSGNNLHFLDYCVIVEVDGLNMISFEFSEFEIPYIGNCVLESLWVHWTYALEDATVQSMDKLV
ncbi:hypothetical protein G9A89_012927 [Geosiphon pyriformis]|nr:hypothetical protein G9A89_012927 [Geosiphon pyriformis]